MSRYTEMLGLNSEEVHNLAIVYTGYAEFNSEENANESKYVASSWLIGALFQAVENPKKSKRYFFYAALSFFKEGNSLWRICEICSQDKIKLDRPKIFDEGFTGNPLDIYFTVLSLLDRQENTLEEIGVGGLFNDQLIYERIPQVNIPFQMLVELVIESEMWGNPKLSKNDALRAVFGRLTEQQQLLMKDKEAWRNLEGAILPLDPIALATSIVFLKRWLRYRSFEELSEVLNGSDKVNTRSNDVIGVILGIAYEILSDEKTDLNQR